MTKAHAGQPNCPFCFVPFVNYPTLRKHCENINGEMKQRKQKEKLPEGRKGPCRNFNNGQGHCSPRFGKCLYDHSIIPDNKREVCFHKEACSYKPHCIFLHPEGQGEDIWLQNKRKTSKVCRFTENGNTCMRSYCSFFHPTSRNNSFFHWDQASRFPLIEREGVMTSTKNIPMMPMRVPVIVKNNLMSRKQFPDLSHSMKEMSLD